MAGNVSLIVLRQSLKDLLEINLDLNKLAFHLLWFSTNVRPNRFSFLITKVMFLSAQVDSKPSLWNSYSANIFKLLVMTNNFGQFTPEWKDCDTMHFKGHS